MNERELDVYASEKSGKWHWKIIGPFPRPAGAGKLRDTCCDEASRNRKVCPGFPAKASAESDGRRRREEIISEMNKLPN